jgi:hypothetical protein
MTDAEMERLADAPSISRTGIADEFNRIYSKKTGETVPVDYLRYYCWDEAFGSTSGPFAGIGGQMVTTFRMEAWGYGSWAIVFCGGRIVGFRQFSIGATWRPK